MTLPKTSLLAALAFAALGPLGHTQQAGPQLHQVQGIKHINYDLATGKITPASDTEKAVALVANFSNTDTSNFFSGGSLDSTANGGPGGPEVWLDWGIIPFDTGSDIVGEFDFAYATTVTSASSVSLKLGFYDGAVGFCADTGLPGASASFTFTGLPGVTTTTSGGVNNAYIVTVNLDGGFSFCNAGVGQPFGFSFESLVGTVAWSAGPILCFAGNGAGGADSNGQVDVFDIYDTEVGNGNVCIGSFFFGGPPSDFSSWFLEMRTAAPDAGGADDAAVLQSNGSGLNPNTYVVSNGLQLGSALVATDSTSGGIGVFLVGYLSPLQFIIPAFGEVLVNVADPAGQLFSTADTGPYLYVAGVANIGVSVPKDLALCGITVHSQTVEFGGGIVLHNANALTIGF